MLNWEGSDLMLNSTRWQEFLQGKYDLVGDRINFNISSWLGKKCCSRYVRESVGVLFVRV